MKHLLSVLALALMSACGPSSAQAPVQDQWRSVNVRATPVDLGVAETGRLRFRGGVALSGDFEMFGGISGLEVVEDGRLIAVTDNGDWIEARIVLDAQGALADVTDVRMAMMRDERGEIFPDKSAGDAEALALLPDGRFAVAFEQTQSVRIYDLNRDGPFGAASAGPRLDEVRRLPPNSGLEAMAATQEGELLIGAEGGGRPTRLWRAPLDAARPVAPFARYPLSAGYSLTSLDRLPDGMFVALERFYAPVIGARARIAHLRFENGRAVREEWATLAPPMPVDNFEGIAAVQMADGGVRLYIVSDDNFSDRQRTLLYAFDLIGTPSP